MHDTELKYRAVFEQAAVGVAEVDSRTGRFLAINARYCQIAGYSAQQMLSKNFHSITHPDDLPIDLGHMQELLAGRIREFTMDKRYIRPDGSIVWVSLTVSPMWQPGEEPSTHIAVVQDITHRRGMQQELEAANQDLQALNRVTALCSASLDLQTVLDQLLDQSLAITGLEGGTICLVGADHALHLVAQRNTSPETIADLSHNIIKVGDCLCGNCAKDCKPLVLWTRQAVLQYATREATRNEQIHFHAAFPLITSQRCLGVLCVFTRTDRKPEDRALGLLETVTRQIAMAIQNAQFHRDLTQELAERRRAEEAERKARAQAEAAAHAKDTFLAMVSHELRAPLASMQVAVDLLQEHHDTNPASSELLQSIREGITSESRIISDLLDLTRLGTGGMSLQRRSLNVIDLLTQAVDAERPAALAKGITLQTQWHCANSMAEADPIRLQQVVGNLLSNAIKFTPHGGVITVRCTSSPQGRIAVEIEDTGIGLDQATIHRLFQPFEQADPSVTRRFGGLGLGLYVARLLTELHGGQLTATSAGVGQGTVFRLELPATASAPEADRRTADRPLDGRRLNVLLVEDNPVTRRLFQRFLEAQGHHVVPAGDAEAALSLANENAVDLVVSDLGLPGVSGWEMMSRLRTTHPVPAIAVSGFGSPEDVQRSHEAGFAEHLVKPVNMPQLAVIIRKLAPVPAAT